MVNFEDNRTNNSKFELDRLEIFRKFDPLCFLFRENERENQLKHMLELLRINASTHVIDIENVSAGKDFII